MIRYSLIMANPPKKTIHISSVRYKGNLITKVRFNQRQSDISHFHTSRLIREEFQEFDFTITFLISFLVRIAQVVFFAAKIA